MSRANVIQTNFTAGEVSPRMYGRVDVNKYFNGARKLRNMLVVPQGGAFRRPGTRFINATKDSSKRPLIKSFKFSAIQPYTLEFGNLYIRFYFNRGVVVRTTGDTTAWLTATSYVVGDFVKESSIIYYCVTAHTSGTFATDLAAVKWVAQDTYEVVSPYLEADLPNLKFTQSADVLYICHPSYQTRTLSRTSATSWSLTLYETTDGPYQADPPGDKARMVTVLQKATAILTTNVAGFSVSGLKNVTGAVTAGGLVKLTVVSHSLSTNDHISVTGVGGVPESRGDWVITVVDADHLTLNSSIFFTNSVYTSGGTIKSGWGTGYREYKENNEWKIAIAGQAFSTTQMMVKTISTYVTYPPIFEVRQKPSGSGSIIVVSGNNSDTGQYDPLFTRSDVGKYIRDVEGNWSRITVFNHSGNVNVLPLTVTQANYPTELLSVSDPFIWASITAGSSTFASTDVNRKMRLQFLSEWVPTTILAYASATLAYIKLHRMFPTDPSGAAEWDSVLETFSALHFSCDGVPTDWKLGAWSATTGWPTCAAFHQERITFANTTHEPLTTWLGETGDYVGFSPSAVEDSTVTDANAITVTLVSREVNAIQWLDSGPVLLVGTAGSEWQIKPSSIQQALTPTNIIASPQTSFGSISTTTSERVGITTLFIQKGGLKLREMSYDFQVDAFTSKDLSIISEHIGRLHSGMSRIALQLNPHNYVWILLGDGKLACVTYEREQEVVAWGIHDLGGVVESIACVEGTTNDYDDVYVVVRRTVNSSTKRYIEVIEHLPTTLKNGFYVDCGLTLDNTTPANTSSVMGLSHLNGETVALVVDGIFVGTRAVSGGSVSVGYRCTMAHVGILNDAIVGLLDPEGGSQAGTSQGKKKRVSEAVARVENSLHFLVACSAPVTDARMTYSESSDPGVGDRNRVVPAPLVNAASTSTFPAPTPDMVALKSGDIEFAVDDSYDNGGRFELVQPEPYPMNIVAIMPKLNTNE